MELPRFHGRLVKGTRLKLPPRAKLWTPEFLKEQADSIVLGVRAVHPNQASAEASGATMR